MTDEQSAYYDSYQAIKVFLTEHTAEYSSLLPLVDAASLFNTKLAALETAIAKQGADNTGVTDDKSEDRALLTTRIDALAGGIAAMAEAAGDSTLEQLVNTSEAKLEKMGDDEFTGKVTTILDAATANSTGLAAYGFDAAAVSEISAFFLQWRGGQGKVLHARGEGVAATKEIARLIPDINNHLSDTMDRLMKVAASGNPSLMDEWEAMRATDDANTQTRALTVTVNSAAGPVAGASATINPGGIQKTTGDEGMFYVQNLPAGNYTLSLSKPGYLPFTPQAFTVVDGEMTSVDATMVEG